MLASPPAFDLLSLDEQATILRKAAIKAAPRTKQDQTYMREYLSDPTKRLIDRIATTPPEDHAFLQSNYAKP